MQQCLFSCTASSKDSKAARYYCTQARRPPSCSRCYSAFWRSRCGTAPAGASRRRWSLQHPRARTRPAYQFTSALLVLYHCFTTAYRFTAVALQVLAPTRELALQTAHVMSKCAGGFAGGRVRVCALHGGAAIEPQLLELREGADVLVATPGSEANCTDSSKASRSCWSCKRARTCWSQRQVL